MKGSMLGAGIGGGHGAPGSPWCHTGTFQLSKGCKEAKSLPSMPKPSHSLCHPTGNATEKEAAPPELRRAVGHRGQWDAGCGAWGRRLCPLPEAAAAVYS